ncbi:MAG TPA: HD domain-containing phosphohydrolase [Lysobacter sp.]
MSALRSAFRPLQLGLCFRDPLTGAHSGRVERLALSLGKSCGLDGRQLETLRAAARLHDIGKIGVPDAILLKPGRLDADERAIIEQHPVIGQRICEAIDHRDATEIALAVRHHHEQWAGGGYPDRIKGEEIPVFSRLIAIADVFDAMTSHRVYQASRTHADALAIVDRERGAHFDPWITDRFVELVDRHREIRRSRPLREREMLPSTPELERDRITA